MSKMITNGIRSGFVKVPSSKSHLHRLLILAALGEKPVRIEKCGRAVDTQATAACLRALGAGIEETDEAFAVTPLVHGKKGLFESWTDLPCRESGATLRLLLPLAGVLDKKVCFEREGRLIERPLSPYKELLCAHGMSIREDGNRLYASGKLESGVYRIPGNISSQFVSGLLLALPLVGGASEIRLASALQSRPYVEMTIAVMREFGVSVSETEHGFAIPGGARYEPPPSGAFQVEGDASQEAFWHLANHLGSNVSILSPASAELQGDAVFPSILETLRASGPNSSPPEIDVSQIPDLVPAIAAAAAFSPRGVVVTHGERLRLKESDRIATSVALLRSFGARAEERPDGLAVFPIPTHAIGRDSKGDVSAPPVHADAAGDHRIAMAAAMLATRRRCELHGASSVAKSWPSFFDDYRRAGGRVEVLSQ